MKHSVRRVTALLLCLILCLVSAAASGIALTVRAPEVGSGLAWLTGLVISGVDAFAKQFITDDDESLDFCVDMLNYLHAQSDEQGYAVSGGILYEDGKMPKDVIDWENDTEISISSAIQKIRTFPTFPRRLPAPRKPKTLSTWTNTAGKTAIPRRLPICDK